MKSAEAIYEASLSIMAFPQSRSEIIFQTAAKKMNNIQLLCNVIAFSPLSLLPMNNHQPGPAVAPSFNQSYDYSWF